LIAAAEKVDSARRWQVYDPARSADFLVLRARGLRSVVMLPLGYRA
jgi:hypothetical protein